ncbi:MAG: hypothetical protein KAS32_21810 [Candidatus Peribacteraceae bacterium]|nr:hypothetical protein [Candidatus Peribacteraceae bacterium]
MSEDKKPKGSVSSVIASGTLEGLKVSALNKEILRSVLMEAIANYKSRMLTYINTNPKIPVATGYLKQSAVDVIGMSQVSGLNFRVFFGFNAPYAKYVDEGRPPGIMPPVNPIIAWCITKGIPAEAGWAVAMAIAERGIDAANFFQPGVAFAKQVLREELIRSLLKRKVTHLVDII